MVLVVLRINGFILFLSGFTGLLIYRFLVMMVAVGSPKGIMRPKSPFYITAWLLYEGATVLPALRASPGGGPQPKGYRPVVDQGDPHVRPEAAGLY